MRRATSWCNQGAGSPLSRRSLARRAAIVSSRSWALGAGIAEVTIGGQYIEPMLPSPCAVCLCWSSTRLCTACLHRFRPVGSRCLRCAIRVPVGQLQCGSCLNSPPQFDRAATAFDYAFPWDRLIAEFKFRGRLEWAKPLADCLADALTPDNLQVDAITPVPLSRQRLKERGYNQSWEIARRLSRRLGLPARGDALLRWRDTPHQVALGRPARDANLRGAFMPNSADSRHWLHGRRIALVDDVLTTGTTANEAARALLEAGAASVHLWVLARTA